MYASCGALSEAQQVLDELSASVQSIVAWNALISGYAQQGKGNEALKCFDCMQCEGFSPNAVTFICALKACGDIGAVTKGEQIHGQIVSLGMLDPNVVLGSTLVDMYARWGSLAKAQEVMEEIPVRNVVAWTTLIAGYAQHGQGEEALKCFDSMQCEGQSPDSVTFICALKACGSIGAIKKGEEIHNKIASMGMLEKDTVLGSTLVDMYARCGALAKAQQVFEQLPTRNVVAWTALIAGYAHHSQGEDALKCFDTINIEGHLPDAVTFICTLQACGSIGALAKGEQIHDKIINLHMLEKDIVLGSTLIDMYVRCGALAKAQKIFDELVVLDVVAWTAIIAGYAQQGQIVEALSCFERMQSNGVGPNSATLVCVLNACSHSGLLDQAEMHFSSMDTEYGFTPNADHYCCMADLFGRAGKLDKVLVETEKMSFADYIPLYQALLGACRKWDDLKMGRLVFEHALNLDENNAAACVCFTNICTVTCLQEDANKIGSTRVAVGR